jgi:DNA end-binding protein Ku
MARSMWRGAIQFGLVTIPVRMYLATESRGGLSFNLLHEEDLQRIQMKIHCPEHGEIPRSETVRGYEWSKGRYVVIEDEDLEAVPLKTVRSIEIERFVPARREPSEAAFVKQPYYLEPEPVGRKAFGLLREVLRESELQAICKIVIKDREHLAALDPFGPSLLLSTLYWPDEVRDLSELELPDEDVEFKPAELAMARQLVDALTGEFDPSQYHDEYREALLRVIDAKVQGEPVEAPPEVRAETSPLADLMAVLEASVRAARGGRAADGAGAVQEAVVTTAEAAAGSRRRTRATAEPVEIAKAGRSRKVAPGEPRRGGPTREADEAGAAAPSRRQAAGPGRRAAAQRRSA